MITVHKYPLKIADEQIIPLPKGARILTVQTQQGIPCLWTLVDTEAQPEDRHILILGTGHDSPRPISSMRYLNTFQLHDGTLIFHVFEILQRGTVS